MILLALVIGIVAGLRAMTPLAAIAWAAWYGARHGGFDLSHSWLAFLGWQFTPHVLTGLALGELITDQLPTTPSRKVPYQFAARIVIGALTGVVVRLGGGSLLVAFVLGIVGAVIGTYGGAWARAKLAAAFGTDWPAALIEDAVAIVAAVLVAHAL